MQARVTGPPDLQKKYIYTFLKTYLLNYYNKNVKYPDLTITKIWVQPN